MTATQMLRLALGVLSDSLQVSRKQHLGEANLSSWRRGITNCIAPCKGKLDTEKLLTDKDLEPVPAQFAITANADTVNLASCHAVHLT